MFHVPYGQAGAGLDGRTHGGRASVASWTMYFRSSNSDWIPVVVSCPTASLWSRK